MDDGGSLKLDSNSVISDGVSVTNGGYAGISGSSNVIQGKLVLNSGGDLNVFGSEQHGLGQHHGDQRRDLERLQLGQSHHRQPVLSASSLTISGTDDSFSGSATVESGLLKFSGTSCRASGSLWSRAAALQVYGQNNTISGSLTISGVASLTLGSDAVVAANVTVNQFGGVKIIGSDNRVIGSILLDDSRQMTISGSGNAISGHLTGINLSQLLFHFVMTKPLATWLPSTILL